MNKMVKDIVKRVLPIHFVRKIRQYIDRINIKRVSNYSVMKFQKNKYLRGVNLIAPIRHDTGLGQSSRLVAGMLELSHIDYMIKYFSISGDISSKDGSFKHKEGEELRYGINLIHVNMHEFARAINKIGKRNLDYRYNIAFWLWEMEDFPEEWIPLIKVLDEIWTPSEFASNAIRKITDKKVYTIPYNIVTETDRNLSRSDFGLPEDTFAFLILFDKNSITDRKNPLDAIEAFKRAFSKTTEDVALVIKMNNADQLDIEKIKGILDGYNIYILSEIMSKPKVNRLIELVDVYVSLHRSEGFGLVIAESMKLGTPTIATNYSSNTEFQTKDNSCLVIYKKEKVGKNLIPYKKDNMWAKPDVLEASKYMRRLYEDRDFYNKIKENGKKGIEESLCSQKVRKLLQQRLDEIYK